MKWKWAMIVGFAIAVMALSWPGVIDCIVKDLEPVSLVLRLMIALFAIGLGTGLGSAIVMVCEKFGNDDVWYA